MSRPSVIISYVHIFMILITCCVITSRQETYNYKIMEIIDDLPNENDMEKYLTALRRIVNFVEGRRFYVNIDLGFGLYLTTVYLRSTVESKVAILSKERHSRIAHLIKKNKKILKYFIKISKERNTIYQVPEVLVKMFNLVDEEITWPNFTTKFNTDLLNNTKFQTRKTLEKKYDKWYKYKKAVYENKTGSPSFTNCLNLLSENPVNKLPELIDCQIPYNCFEYIQKGVDYGYEITHRLLILLAARHWRRCFFTKSDKTIIDNLCLKMYNEVEYMAYHDFGVPDLFMDHVTLCSFEGHAQFLRRSWIDELLDFQTSFGCFKLTRPSPGSALMVAMFHNISEKADIMVWEETCNAHATGVASVMLSAAIAFITENILNREIYLEYTV